MNRQRISWLMDMDGVIVQEEHLVPGADRFVARLAETGHPFLILTNNSMYTTRDLAARLNRLGMSRRAGVHLDLGARHGQVPGRPAPGRHRLRHRRGRA